MSKHFEDGQYDDDLTIGVDDFDTDDLFAEVDLLKYKPFESPLAKLKSLVLSIDWEITDDILQQFNEELISLRELWANEKIYLVYIQALQTISKYIYQEKSSAHPNAVKFLPAFYYNLEKIVLDENLTDPEKHDILLADVERFNNLKKQLVEKSARATGTVKTEDVLQNLKALVLSIDWEITEADLDELRQEVLALERAYKASKPKLILLQGIGTLAAYIRHKGANAHADAFTLLHDFYGTLERISTKKMSLEKEKENLFVEVEKFNAFKAIISSTISPEALSRDETEDVITTGESPSEPARFQPAFADVNDDSVSGFQEEQVAASLDGDEDITSRLDSFFSDDPNEPEVEAITPELPSLAEEVEEDVDVESEAETRLDDFFKDDFLAEESIQLDKEFLLQGVDVETEADDDSEEEALPVFGDEIAPALVDNDEVSSFSEKPLAEVAKEQDVAVEDDFSLSFIDESSDFGEALTDLDGGVDDEDVSPLPAFASFDQDAAEGSNGEPEFEDQLGIESTLDAFFGDFDDTESEVRTEIVSEVDGTEGTHTPSQQVNLLKEYFDEDIAGVESEDNLVDSTLAVDEGIEESVDQFFDSPATESVTAPAQSEVDEIGDSEVDESIDQFFGFLDEEDVVVAELSDSDELEESAVAFTHDTTDDSDLEEVDAFFDTPVSESVVAVGGLGADESDGTVVDAHKDQGDLVAFIAVDESVPEDTVERSESSVADVFEEASTTFAEEPVELVDCFVALRSSIQSLGIEIETQIINGVFGDINQLRQRVDATFLEKSFLQLLSTVVQHIDCNRYLSSDMAYDLVLSIFAGLENTQSVSVEEGEQLLLGETYKVLQWQQDLISTAQAASTSAEDSGDSDLKSGSTETSSVVEETLFSEGEDELIYAGLEEELAEEAGEGLSAAGVDDIRSELHSLRETLQDEISKLRAELLGKK